MNVLIKHIAEKFFEWNDDAKNHIAFAENLKNCDAYIATGSNNSSRYFEYYFSKYPNIIRRNRTSVAILNGNETKEELDSLADDMQFYYGMGCRNVTKLFVPEGYDFIALLDALRKYNRFADFHKYRNNYDYQLALLIMNHKYYMTNDSIILTENESVFAPVSQVNYSFYNEPKTLAESLKNNTDIQCIVGKDFIPFGKAQSPSLTDYADGIDTMQFLKTLAIKILKLFNKILNFDFTFSIMKKFFLLLIIAVKINSVHAQDFDTIPPYQKDSLHIPEFTVLKIDSTYTSDKIIPKDKPVVIIYFSPNAGIAR